MKFYRTLAMVTTGAALSIPSLFIQIKQAKAADFTFTQSGYTLTASPIAGGSSIPPAGFPSPSTPYEIVGSFTTSGTTITSANVNILDDVVNFDRSVQPPVNLSISTGGVFAPATNYLSLSVSGTPTSGIVGPGAVLTNSSFTSFGGSFHVDFYHVGESIHGYSGTLSGTSSQPAIVTEVPEPDGVAADALLLVLGTFSLSSYVGKKVRRVAEYASK